jgi:hypothetical protein
MEMGALLIVPLLKLAGIARTEASIKTLYYTYHANLFVVIDIIQIQQLLILLLFMVWALL